MKKEIEWLRHASVGIHIAVCFAIGWFFGTRLDAYFETEPILTVVFIFFGVAAGFLNLFRELNIINDEEQTPDDAVPPRADSRDDQP